MAQGEARAAYAFTAANLAVGALNYLFQVYAVAVLDKAAFGTLSAWLAEVTVVSAIAPTLQLVSLESPIGGLRRLLRTAGALAAGVLVLHGALWRAAPHLWLAVVAVLGTTLFYVAIGQLQARLRLGRVAIALFAAALVRFVYPFVTGAFYVAHALTGFVGLVVLGALADDDPDPPRRRGGVRLDRPILLAIVGIVFPSVDVIAISWTHDAATTGAFSKVALVARFVFFGGAAVVQMLLPYQVRREREEEAPLPPFAARIERHLGVAIVAGALAAAVLADVTVLRGAPRDWLYGTCASAGLLVAVLAEVQRLATTSRMPGAILAAVGVAVAGAVAAVASSTVTGYVALSVAGYALVLGAAALAVRFGRGAS